MSQFVYILWLSDVYMRMKLAFPRDLQLATVLIEVAYIGATNVGTTDQLSEIIGRRWWLLLSFYPEDVQMLRNEKIKLLLNFVCLFFLSQKSKLQK